MLSSDKNMVDIKSFISTVTGTPVHLAYVKCSSNLCRLWAISPSPRLWYIFLVIFCFMWRLNSIISITIWYACACLSIPVRYQRHSGWFFSMLSSDLSNPQETKLCLFLISRVQELWKLYPRSLFSMLDARYRLANVNYIAIIELQINILVILYLPIPAPQNGSYLWKSCAWI